MTDEYMPIERDDMMARDYIPLPGGWEVQTLGHGSTFRICDPGGERLPIPDSPYLHETLTKMARAVNAAWKAALSPPALEGMEDLPRLLDIEKAWLAVCDTLTEVVPDWYMSKEVGRECACNAIRKLASPVAAQAVTDAEQVIALLVAGGFVAQAKVDEALDILADLAHPNAAPRDAQGPPMSPGDSFSWNAYKPQGFKGTATWRIGGHVQAAEFPSFTHAHAINLLVEEAYKAGRRQGEQSLAAMVRAQLPEPTP